MDCPGFLAEQALLRYCRADHNIHNHPYQDIPYRPGKKIGVFFRNVDFRIFAEVFGRDRQEKDDLAAKANVQEKNGKEMFRDKEAKETVVSGKTEKEVVSEPELIDEHEKDSA